MRNLMGMAQKIVFQDISAKAERRPPRRREPLAEPLAMKRLKPERQETLDVKLFHAAREGNSGRIENLIRKGADPNARDAHGQTPLMIAVYLGRLTAAETLINAGAAVNAEDDMGTTALMSAVDRRDRKAVELLIKSGADVGKSSSDTSNVVMLARRSGYRELESKIRRQAIEKALDGARCASKTN
jgi:ankyrin repeat protein